MEQLQKAVTKARERFDQQVRSSDAGNSHHGGLVGRPNLTCLTANDPEVLRNYKFLGFMMHDKQTGPGPGPNTIGPLRNDVVVAQ